MNLTYTDLFLSSLCHVVTTGQLFGSLDFKLKTFSLDWVGEKFSFTQPFGWFVRLEGFVIFDAGLLGVDEPLKNFCGDFSNHDEKNKRTGATQSGHTTSNLFIITIAIIILFYYRTRILSATHFFTNNNISIVLTHFMNIVIFT